MSASRPGVPLRQRAEARAGLLGRRAKVVSEDAQGR